MTEAKKLVLSIIVVIVTLAGAGTWLVLGMRQAGDLRGAIQKKGGELAELNRKISEVPALRQERQKLVAELDEYETILPNAREINKIIDTLSEYQKKAGIEIKQFTPVREKADNKSTTSYLPVAYELDLVGDYFSFVRFLNLLETHNRFIQVDTFTIKQKDENNPVDEISLRLSTFVYDPKSKAAPAAKSPNAKAPATRKPVAAKKAAPELPFDLQKELGARFVYASDVRVRDPFSNPLTRRVVDKRSPDKTPKRAPAGLATADEERAVVEGAEKTLAGVEPLIAADNLDEAEKLLAETDAARAQSYRDADAVERAKALDALWRNLDLKVRIARGEKLYRAVSAAYEKMTKAFDAEDYDEVFRQRAMVDVALGKDLAAQFAPEKKKDATVKVDKRSARKPAPAVEEKPAEGDPIHERLAEVVKACDALVTRAEVRKEFASAGIKIQGTFWSGTGESRRAVAIINGQTVSEGEALKSKDAKSSKKNTAADAEIIVTRIERDRVVFTYRSEQIEKSQYQTN